MCRLKVLSIGMLFCAMAVAIVAQSSQVALLFQQLQLPEMTDQADAKLREMARADPNVRQYLSTHLPGLIANGPSKPESWNNAVRLAGDLRIVEAVPDLAKWIGSQTGLGITGLSLELRLENDPAGKALAQIGEPALPTLAQVLNQGDERKRRDALYALKLIGSPAAKAIFREHLPNEPDPSLRAFMERALEVWLPSAVHCTCDVIQRALEDFDQIRVGLTRQVLERHKFVGGPGPSSRDRTSYSYQSCGDIQFQVDFGRDANILGDQNYSPNDVITKISALTLRNPSSD